jgi:hypothetical protein
VTAPVGATAGVEVVVRRSADVEYVFAINHTHQEGSVAAAGTYLLTGQVHPAPAPTRARHRRDRSRTGRGVHQPAWRERRMGTADVRR